jgi:SnoaL-like domain
MSPQANQNLIVRYYHEMWNKWNFAPADQLLAEEISFRGSLGTETHGRAAFCDYMSASARRVSGFSQRDRRDDRRKESRLRAAHLHRNAPWRISGVAPTGAKVSYAGAASFRIENGQIS